MSARDHARKSQGPASRAKVAKVVELAPRRTAARQRACRARLAHGMETSRRAFQRLIQAGLVFTRRGTRVGRELLLAHQKLQDAADRFDRQASCADDPLLAEIDRLLLRSERLTSQTLDLVASRR